MKLEFEAQMIHSTDSDADILVVGAIDSDGRLLAFQRGLTEETQMNEPPLFEIWDHVEGRHGIVSKCRCSRNLIHIFLTPAQNGYDEVEVSLRSPIHEYPKFKEDLARIFLGYDSILEIENYA